MTRQLPPSVSVVSPCPNNCHSDILILYAVVDAVRISVYKGSSVVVLGVNLLLNAMSIFDDYF
jgi:hypothetical protein